MNILNLWRADHDDQREIMVVPCLRDVQNWRCDDKVKVQCRRCAEQLVPFFFRWAKTFPSLSAVKTWDSREQKFRGLDLDLFALLIEERFRIRTEDGRAWRLDKLIARLIWAECISDDSPLPPASWVIELKKKREARI
jgi:hypothetical protein